MVRPALDELQGIEAWDVRTESPDKLLSIQSNSLQVSELQNALSELGFEAIPVA
jgi:copper chaperone